MQNHAAVFRTGETMQEGIDQLEQIFASFADVNRRPIGRLIWNTDLIETLELENLLCRPWVRSSRRSIAPRVAAHRRGKTTPIATTQLAQAHAVWVDAKGAVQFRLPARAAEDTD